MEFENKFYSVLEAIAPQSFPDSTLRQFTQEFLNLIQTNTRTPDQLETLLSKFKNIIQPSPRINRLWSKVEDLLRPLFLITNNDERLIHLNKFYYKLQENLVSPTRNNNYNSRELDQEYLDAYNRFHSPVGERYTNNNPFSGISNVPYAESFETVDKFSDRRSLVSSYHQQMPNRFNNLPPMKILTDPFYANTTSEDEILKYAFYTLLGTTSDMFPIKSNSIHIPTSIPNATSGLLHLIFEASLLYISLSDKIERYKNIQTSPMKKSLIIKIEQKLSEYTNHVNFLSTQAKINTLKSLYKELYDTILYLRVYIKLVNEFEYTRGDEYISKFHSLKTHGNTVIRQIADELYQSLISFYYDYMINWLAFGKLGSVVDEFFIDNDKSQLFLQFQMKSEKIPQFMSKDVARQIFIIGKTYTFLTKYCKELSWANEFSNRYLAEYNNVVRRTSTTDLFLLIKKQYIEIVKYCQETLNTKFYFRETINMLKNVLLMGKNDLIDAIMIKAKDILDTPSASLTSNMSRILQDVINQSSLRNYLNRDDKNYLINRIDARVLDLGHGLLGWDVFTLEYDVLSPLSVILNVNRQDGRKEYLRIFNLLWKYKMNAFFSNNEMIKSKELIHSFRKIRSYSSISRDILNKISKLSILRSSIAQFNTKIETHYFQFVVDRNLKNFEHEIHLDEEKDKNLKLELRTLKNGLLILNEPLKPVKHIFNFQHDQSEAIKLLTIEEIDSKHNEFLNNILSHKLLSGQYKGKITGEPYAYTLMNILKVTSEFMANSSKLHEVAHDLFIQINLQRNEDISELINQFNEISIEIVRNYKDFRKRTYILIKDLREDGDTELHKLSKILR